MKILLLLCSLALIVSGLTGYFGATPDAETGKVSPTALIPAFIGTAMLLAGLLSFSPKLYKHAMHAGAAIALLGTIGIGMRLPKVLALQGESPDANLVLWVHIISLVAFLVFLVAAIRFFVMARILKKAGPTEPTPSS